MGSDAHAARATDPDALKPFGIKRVEFRNRILRSSVGGRMGNWDNQPTELFKNFEKRFADGGVGAIISTTLGVHERRKGPLQYPSISHDRFVPRLKRYIGAVRETGCRYIVQIGDPGYASQNSLFPERDDALSSSPGFDAIFGYHFRRRAMSAEEIRGTVENFRRGAARVVATGADGIEVTAAKGYLIHQFLNPGINRRNDDYGGNETNRFRLLEEIVRAVRAEVGGEYLFGVRIAAEDLNHVPPLYWLLRTPHRAGNDLQTMLRYGKRLAELGVDYLHVVSGYGFYSPRIVPGRFPTQEANIFFNHTSHLGFKAGARSVAFNLLSRIWGVRTLFELAAQLGWRYEQGINLDYAGEFKRATGLAIIANGGFQDLDVIQGAVRTGRCDAVSLARALIANPDLVNAFFAKGRPRPDNPCTYCNRCIGRTATHPLGCYDVSRFGGDYRAMEDQIMAFNRLDPIEDGADA
ncbi:MAG: NADH:flavin oxidoreductase [Gammaproteobacteria bacterium]|nr:NADH:flavin oxidoreductase [Gammaproteobacteria bacterium]